ncbi:DTW domain-containing protein [bacterium]|nr:DTW domain-containing protein [bacterium]MBU1994048.1 DTW domain-containing protein [bacterium]
MKTLYCDRKKCYTCYRPKSSCMCEYVHTIKTNTKFVILMHPKEFKKVKNGTGHLTNLALENSELFVGIDFTHHKQINEIISEYESFVLYPSKNAVNLSSATFDTFTHAKKNRAIFIIDSTWACSVKILRESKNLHSLKHLSFESTKLSQFKIKEQPAEYCLSTIESTLEVIALLNAWHVENIEQNDLDMFLNPFNKMIEYQLARIDSSVCNSVRFK